MGNNCGFCLSREKKKKENSFENIKELPNLNNKKNESKTNSKKIIVRKKREFQKLLSCSIKTKQFVLCKKRKLKKKTLLKKKLMKDTKNWTYYDEKTLKKLFDEYHFDWNILSEYFQKSVKILKNRYSKSNNLNRSINIDKVQIENPSKIDNSYQNIYFNSAEFNLESMSNSKHSSPSRKNFIKEPVLGIFEMLNNNEDIDDLNEEKICENSIKEKISYLAKRKEFLESINDLIDNQ